jgi:hypothetical protein
MSDDYDLLIQGYKFKLICFACPQSFDVLDSWNRQVAYVKVRHGSIKVVCPDVGGQVVYESKVFGDGLLMTDEQMFHLNRAVEGIQNWVIEKMYEKVVYD